jgi:hypothetical protein
MRTDVLDFPEETLATLPQSEAEIAAQAAQKSVLDLKIVLDNLVNSVLAMNMRIDLQQAQIKLLSQRNKGDTQ